jgi:hypothetical protein
MQITVKVIYQNKNINDFVILIDESLSDVKERFFFYNKTFYPSFLKLTNDTNKLIENNKFIYDYLHDNKIIYMTLLTDILEQFISSYQLTLDMLYTAYKKQDDIINTIVDDLKKEGYNINNYELLGALLILLYNNNNSEIKNELNAFNNYITKCYTFVTKNFTDREAAFNKFYNECLKHNLKDYYKTNTPYIHIKQLSLEYKLTQKLQKNKLLKLKNIFNTFKLSNLVPFIALGEHGDIPSVKLYNNITDAISKKEMSSWLMQNPDSHVYKKIKGLLFKIKRTKYISYGNPLYATLTLNENCNIVLSIDFTKHESTSDINLIIKDVQKYIRPCLNDIERLSGIELNYTAPEIKSISTSCDLNKRIDTNFIQNTLLNKYLSSYLFELKTKKNECDDLIEEEEFQGEYEDEDEIDIQKTSKVTDITKKNKNKEISLYYKKYISSDAIPSYRIRKPCNDLVKLDTDKMGITVQVKDNLYTQGSIVSICSANDINEVYTIIDQLLYLNNLNEKQIEIKKPVKDKSRIKYIRERLKTVGLNIEAKSCQPTTRHPSLDDDNKIDDNFVLKYNGLRIVCDDNEYKYPGFISDKSVCCFKNDKREDKKYKANIEKLQENDYIYPSNYVISVSDLSGIPYNTLLLKMDNLETSENEYFFLNNSNDLVHIKDVELIDHIESDLRLKEENTETIWLNKILLNDLTKPNNNCKYNLDFNNKNELDLNRPCSHHTTHIYFGYDTNGFACCFNESLNASVKEKEQLLDLKKVYIIKKEKILFSNQLGLLLPIFDNIFNTVKTDIPNVKNGKFHRMGVFQNNSAFLNAVSLGIKNVEDSNIIKKDIIKYISDNPLIFDKLNNGDIRYKYKTIDNYINWINTNKNIMNVYDLLHLLHVTYNMNIIVFNIPVIHDKTEQKIDDKNIKIICNSNCKPINENKYIVIFKRNDKYDILAYNNDKDIHYSFSYDNSEIFKLLNEYYNKTCISKNIYPKNYNNYKFDEFINANILIKTLENTKFKIIGQIVNNDKKVNMLISNSNILIPIKENVIIDNLNIVNNLLISADEYLNKITELNTILLQNKLPQINILGVTANKSGLVTNFANFIIPIIPDRNIPKQLKVLDINYYPIIDTIGTIGTSELNAEQIYNNNNLNIQNEIINIKNKLSYIINNSKKLKKYIFDKQTKNGKLSDDYIQKSRFELIKMYNDFFTNIIKVMKDKYNETIDNNSLYLSIISNEIIDDNIKNSFFNGVVTLNNLNTKEVKLQQNESLLSNYNDLKTFMKSYYQD